jgi:hypothetical protein
MHGRRRSSLERKGSEIDRFGEQERQPGQAVRTCQRERQAERVSGRGSQNMSVGEEGRT